MENIPVSANISIITIRLSRIKLFLLITGSWAFVTASIWLWLIADSLPAYNYVLLKIVGLIGGLFFGCCGVYGGKKIFDNSAGLIIDEVGIRDNSSAIGVFFVKWENIEGFAIEEVSRTKFLLIMVNNADELIAQQRGWKQKLMSANMAMYGTPVTISSNSLQCSFNHLVQLITDRYEATKR